VQAQDARAAVLSIWARSDGLTAGDVERERQEERSIVRTWLNRGTLHLAAADDVGWLLPLLGPRFIRTTRRRHEELGLDGAVLQASLTAIQEILSGHRLTKRAELIERLAKRGFPTEGQAAYHLLHHAGLSGLVCYGPERDGEDTFVLLEEWAQVGDALPEDEAHAELARRYLAAYAPAGPADMAAWSGLTLTQARAAFGAIVRQLVGVEFGGETLWLLSSQEEWLGDELTEGLNLRLLPRFDTYLLGYRDRRLAVPQEFAKRVHPGGGILYPVVLVDGLAAGTWKIAFKADHMRVVIDPFESLGDEAISGLEDEIQHLAHFLGTEVSAEISS
jgi:hypothetical protein